MSRYDPAHEDAPEEARTSGWLGMLVRLNRYLLALLIVPAGLIYFKLPMAEQEAALTKLRDLERSRDALRDEVAYQEQRFDLIKNNTEYFESIVRDTMHKQKDGEIILWLKSPPADVQ